MTNKTKTDKQIINVKADSKGECQLRVRVSGPGWPTHSHEHENNIWVWGLVMHAQKKTTGYRLQNAWLLKSWPESSHAHVLFSTFSSFRFVLNFLRDGQRAVLPSQADVLRQLLVEADFYNLKTLVSTIREQLISIKKSNSPDVSKAGLPSKSPDVSKAVLHSAEDKPCSWKYIYTHLMTEGLLEVFRLHEHIMIGFGLMWASPFFETFVLLSVEFFKRYEKLLQVSGVLNEGYSGRILFQNQKYLRQVRVLQRCAKFLWFY